MMTGMNESQLIEKIVREVIGIINKDAPRFDADDAGNAGDVGADSELTDLTSLKERKRILVDSPLDEEALAFMMEKTPARIGIGKAGPRLKTSTLLTLRADHAAAQGSVYTDTDPALLEKMDLFTVSSMCIDRDQHLTRPDLGRQFSGETIKEIQSKCKMSPRVQIYVSDGLSSTAIEANIADVLPALTNGLKQYGIEAGTPFFVKFGRVPAMDAVSEALKSEVTCVLIGERPGLATFDSMSAYIAYKATVGMPESRRTVVSNIHSGGISATEAGAYIADVIKKMLELRQSGIDLKL
jgi:ethanolamine ammonia-lyase small subunit